VGPADRGPNGRSRRRRWSADDKARILWETLAPGARVSEVARRWQVCSQQVFGWPRAARRDLRTTRAMTTTPALAGFVPIVTETVPAATVPHTSAQVIEVRLAGAVVRVMSGLNDMAQLTAVLRQFAHQHPAHDQCSLRSTHPVASDPGFS
jgi:transposase